MNLKSICRLYFFTFSSFSTWSEWHSSSVFVASTSTSTESKQRCFWLTNTGFLKLVVVFDSIMARRRWPQFWNFCQRLSTWKVQTFFSFLFLQVLHVCLLLLRSFFHSLFTSSVVTWSSRDYFLFWRKNKSPFTLLLGSSYHSTMSAESDESNWKTFLSHFHLLHNSTLNTVDK